MKNRKDTIKEIFEFHGPDAIYITPTGYISREVYNMYPDNKNIYYMEGSMGIAPAIGIGIAISTYKNVVVINGDGAHLMHLGLTHTIRDLNLNNLFIHILDNGVYESVGGSKCSKLENSYPGIFKIWKISCDGKPLRVGEKFKIQNIKDFIKC